MNKDVDLDSLSSHFHVTVYLTISSSSVTSDHIPFPMHFYHVSKLNILVQKSLKVRNFGEELKRGKEVRFTRSWSFPLTSPFGLHNFYHYTSSQKLFGLTDSGSKWSSCASDEKSGYG